MRLCLKQTGSVSSGSGTRVSGLNRHLYYSQLTKHQPSITTLAPFLSLQGLLWHMPPTDLPGDPGKMPICPQTVPSRAGEQLGCCLGHQVSGLPEAEDNGLLFVQFPCPGLPPAARWQVRRCGGCLRAGAVWAGARYQGIWSSNERPLPS